MFNIPKHLSPRSVKFLSTLVAGKTRPADCRPARSAHGQQAARHLASGNETAARAREAAPAADRRLAADASQPKSLFGAVIDNASVGAQTSASVYDPPYLAELKPKVGYYDLVNLQIKGYDFVVLEKYQSYLHKTMRKMGFNVVNAWAAPHQELNLECLAGSSAAIEGSVALKIYERNLQIKEALVTKLPILIDIINITSPPGVSFNIHRHSAEHEDCLYFEDSVLKSMKSEYKELSEEQLIGA